MFGHSLLEETELDLDKILENFPTSPFDQPNTLQLYKKLCAAILDVDVNSPLIEEPNPKVLDHQYLSGLAKYFIPEAIETKTSEPIPMPAVRKRKHKKQMMKKPEVTKVPKTAEPKEPAKEIKTLKALGPFFIRPAFSYIWKNHAGVKSPRRRV